MDMNTLEQKLGQYLGRKFLFCTDLLNHKEESLILTFEGLTYRSNKFVLPSWTHLQIKEKTNDYYSISISPASFDEVAGETLESFKIEVNESQEDEDTVFHKINMLFSNGKSVELTIIVMTLEGRYEVSARDISSIFSEMFDRLAGPANHPSALYYQKDPIELLKNSAAHSYYYCSLEEVLENYLMHNPMSEDEFKKSVGTGWNKISGKIAYRKAVIDNLQSIKRASYRY